MQERRLENEMIQQMLDWLGRGIDPHVDGPEMNASSDMKLTEEDCKLLRDLRIAIP